MEVHSVETLDTIVNAIVDSVKNKNTEMRLLIFAIITPLDMSVED